MTKFALKREIVSAEQYFPGKNIDGVEIEVFGSNEIALVKLWDSTEVVQPGEWIIKYPHGQFSKCSDKAFRAMYEQV